MADSYKHPPIVEAVVEFRYGDGKDARDELERARRAFAVDYPKVDELRMIPLPQRDSRDAFVGYKFTSRDGTRVVQLRSDLVVVAKLAPYAGWLDLAEQVRITLRRAAPLIRGRRITRLATRFINRFDIPATREPIRYEDYLRVGVSDLPFAHDAIGTLSFNIGTMIEGGRFGVVLRGAGGQGLLVDHTSVLLDMDIFDQDAATLPRTQKDAFSVLEEMRARRNEIFEACITDRARELIA